MRTGCSAVGAKMSRIPPRTANSPRRPTMSTRVYDSSTSRAITSSKPMFLADAKGYRFLVAQPRCHRLQQRTRRGHHHPQRRAQPGVVGVSQPAQHHQTGADGINAGREPLVRQGLPGREDSDRTAEDAAQFGGEVVGFAPGRGDHQQGTLPRQRTGHEQPRAGRAQPGSIRRVAPAVDSMSCWKVGAVSANSTSPAIGVSGRAGPGAVMMHPF